MIYLAILTGRPGESKYIIRGRLALKG